MLLHRSGVVDDDFRVFFQCVADAIGFAAATFSQDCEACGGVSYFFDVAVLESFGFFVLVCVFCVRVVLHDGCFALIGFNQRPVDVFLYLVVIWQADAAV